MSASDMCCWCCTCRCEEDGRSYPVHDRILSEPLAAVLLEIRLPATYFGRLNLQSLFLYFSSVFQFTFRFSFYGRLL